MTMNGNIEKMDKGAVPRKNRDGGGVGFGARGRAQIRARPVRLQP